MRMPKLVEVNSPDDILDVYRGTAVEELLRYHNLREPMPTRSGTPKMFVSMCIDFRKFLLIPNEFAYIMRTAGARLRGNEFELLYAVAVGGVSNIVLMGHTDCGMTRVMNQRDQFVAGLGERAGVDEEEAGDIFDELAPGYAIADPVYAMVKEARKLRRKLHGVLIAPLLFNVENDRLIQILEPKVIGVA
jgi:carbonic anhydrase